MSGVSDQRSNAMERRINMGDFVGFADDIENGMAYLEHHQILGAKWGQKNGPPYPLGSGDHSSAEKSAAKAAGVKVGSDSGKGSIENVKKKKSGAQNQVKKPKKEMTDEEKREAALKAVKSGDKKKIAKYMDNLSTDELRDAQARAQMKDSLKKEDPSEKKTSKEEIEKQEVIRSGDKERVKQYADKMSLNELKEAMDKVDLMAKLNYTPPEPTAMDKMRDIANKLGTMKEVAEKGIGAYNVVAKVMNAANKDANWPIIGEKPKGDGGNDKDKEKEQMKEGAKKVIEGVAKSYEEQAKEKFENKQIDYKYNKKYEDWEAKQKAKAAKKDNTDSDDDEATESKSEGGAHGVKGQDWEQTSEKEAKMQQHESNKQFGIHRFNTKTSDRLSTAADAVNGNEFSVPVAFTDKNYQKGPQTKKVNWDTGINAENMSNWKSTWKSVEEVQSNRPISDDLTPAEEAFLNSFKR